MQPENKRRMISWMLDKLQQQNMFNSRLIDQKVMTKSNLDKSKHQQLVFCDTVARRKQVQLETFLEALNKYFHDKMERNNITIEVNCGF
jgi:hypothetical protein